VKIRAICGRQKLAPAGLADQRSCLFSAKRLKEYTKNIPQLQINNSSSALPINSFQF
jgi:hypothetical protein